MVATTPCVLGRNLITILILLNNSTTESTADVIAVQLGGHRASVIAKGTVWPRTVLIITSIDDSAQSSDSSFATPHQITDQATRESPSARANTFPAYGEYLIGAIHREDRLASKAQAKRTGLLSALLPQHYRSYILRTEYGYSIQILRTAPRSKV
jgi:hypothetical protein